VAPQDDEALTPAEAAAFLKLSQNTVYVLLAERKLPGRKVGGSWRILRSKLVEWLEGA
jgi:excisionase family DNA binding protein